MTSSTVISAGKSLPLAGPLLKDTELIGQRAEGRFA